MANLCQGPNVNEINHVSKLGDSIKGFKLSIGYLAVGLVLV